VVGLRAGEHQQYGGSRDQEIAGGSDPERRIDAEDLGRMGMNCGKMETNCRNKDQL
jgi:hypothetical protein